MGISSKVVWEKVRVDHFVLKSREEFATKRTRGMALEFPRPDWDAFFDVHDRNEIAVPMPLELVARTKREILVLTRMLETPCLPLHE